MPVACRKQFTEETEEELLNMTRDEVTLNLNDRQVRFCEIYMKNFNIKLAAISAGYSELSATIAGWKLRQNPDISRYLTWLKLKLSKQCHIEAMDIIDQYVRIAFADITDFVEVKGNTLKLIDGAKIDGQLVSKIKQGRDGISVELVDKLRALDKLEKYFECMPADWRQKIEEKKIELMREKLDLERAKLHISDDENEDDGFLQALKSTASEVWSDA
jgi:phage terminase small subunit